MDDLDLFAEGRLTIDQDEPQLSRAERRDQQIQRILEAAKVCFVRSGFQGASMQQICAEAGMSPGALYRYFRSKEAIIEAICDADRAEDAKLFASILSNPSVVDGVVQGAMAHIRQLHETSAAPLFAEISAEAMRNPAVAAACARNMDDVLELFRCYLGNAVVRGEIDPLVDVGSLLHTMMAMVHGIAANDLPARGVPFEKLELLIRSAVEALLRPTTPTRQ
jgi:TetR/AcrR family transcriptional regulator, repressor for uid operon